MLEALQLEFFQRVLLAGLLASIACGVLGTYVVAKRISSLSGGIAHAAFGGVGLGFLLDFNPMLGGAAFGVVAGVIIGLAYRRLGSAVDALVSMVWAVGMALGIVFIQLAPGYAPDMTTYLFGNLLYASWDYVVIVAVLDVVILATVAVLFRHFEAVSFDEEFSEISGVPVELLIVGLLALVSLAVVTLIRVVGIILVIALLTIPASIGRHWATSLQRMMAIAVAVAAACTTAGLFLSYGVGRVSPGPLVILIAAAGYAVSGLLRSVRSGSAGPR